MENQEELMNTTADVSEIEGVKDEQRAIKGKMDYLQEFVAYMANTVLKPELPKDSPNITYSALEKSIGDCESNQSDNSDLSKVLKDHPVFNAQMCTVISEMTNLDQRLSKLDTLIEVFSNRLNFQEQYGRLYNLLLHKVTGVPYKAKGFVFSHYIVDLLNSLQYSMVYYIDQ